MAISFDKKFKIIEPTECVVGHSASVRSAPPAACSLPACCPCLAQCEAHQLLAQCPVDMQVV